MGTRRREGQALFGKLDGFTENMLSADGEAAILNFHIISPTLDDI